MWEWREVRITTLGKRSCVEIHKVGKVKTLEEIRGFFLFGVYLGGCRNLFGKFVLHLVESHSACAETCLAIANQYRYCARAGFLLVLNCQTKFSWWSSKTRLVLRVDKVWITLFVYIKEYWLSLCPIH
jgi:hypothetical protein